MTRQALLIALALIAASQASLLLTPTGCGRHYAQKRPVVPLYFNRGLTAQVVHSSLPELHAALFCAESGSPRADEAARGFLANVSTSGGAVALDGGGSLVALVPGNAAVGGLFANLQLSLDASRLPLLWVPLDHSEGDSKMRQQSYGNSTAKDGLSPQEQLFHPRSRRVTDTCLVEAVAAAVAAPSQASYSSFFTAAFHHYALVKWELAARLTPVLSPSSWALVLDPDLVGFGDPLPHLRQLIEAGPFPEDEEPPCDVYFQADATASAWGLTSSPSAPLFTGVFDPTAPEYSILRSSLREAVHNGLWGVGSTYGLLNTGMALWSGSPAAAALSSAIAQYVAVNLAYRGPAATATDDARRASRQWHAMDHTALRPGHNLDDQTLFNMALASLYRTPEEAEASEPRGELSGSTLSDPILPLVTFLRAAMSRRCVTLHRRDIGRPHIVVLPPGAGHPQRSLGDAGPFEPQTITQPTAVPLWAPLEEEEDAAAYPGAAAATAAARAALLRLPRTLRLGLLPPTAFSGRLAMELTGMCGREGEAPHPLLVHYNWLSGTAKKAALMVRDGAWYLDGGEVPGA